MNARAKLSIFSIAIFAAALLSQPAFADGRGRSVRSAGKGVRAARAIAQPSRGRSIRLPNAGIASRGARGGSPFPLLDALSRAGNGGGRGSSPFPLLEALGRASSGGNNDFPILRELERQSRGSKHSGNDALDLLYGLQQLGGYGGYSGYGQGYGYGNSLYPYVDSYNRNNAYEEHSDAIRDAAIVNAVGQVVSTIVQTQAQPRAYVQQTPVYAQPAPVYTQPARTYVAPSPQGHYEKRRETVGGGYYEREQIWVPEMRNPSTGHIVEGHYETVRRWVPEVIQESQVWVAP